jgi:hypothetical protein
MGILRQAPSRRHLVCRRLAAWKSHDPFLARFGRLARHRRRRFLLLSRRPAALGSRSMIAERAISCAAVLLVGGGLSAAFLMAGSPQHARNLTLDERRVIDLWQISQTLRARTRGRRGAVAPPALNAEMFRFTCRWVERRDRSPNARAVRVRANWSDALPALREVRPRLDPVRADRRAFTAPLRRQ